MSSDYPNPVVIAKKQPVQGYLIAAKGMAPVLGFKVKKWGNGTNRSGTRRKFIAHPQFSKHGKH